MVPRETTKMVPIPAELSTLMPGFAPRVAWLRARYGGVPLPLDPSDFVECIAAIRQKFDTRLSKNEANSLIEFGIQLHAASIEQAPYNDIHPAVPVPLELLLYSRITEFPSVAAAQGSTGGIPVPVEAADFEASSNLVASVARWGGKPTKVAAGQFWNDLVDATEYPRLAGIRVPPAMKRQLSIASDTTSASDRTSSSR